MSDYIQLASRTACNITNPSVSNDILHFAIGIVGEVHEYRTAKTFLNRHEELGDICWYVANFYRCLEVDADFLDVRVNRDASVDTLEEKSHALLNDVKRKFAYNKQIDDSTFVTHLNGIVSDVAGLCQIGMETLLYGNIEKLRTRYPDKYSDQCADDRDLLAEYDILEKTISK